MNLVDSQASLPEKVNVYLSAYFNGSGWFTNVVDNDSATVRLNGLRGHDTELAWLRRELGIASFGDAETNHILAAAARARLRDLIVNAYFSAYPDVPAKDTLRSAYLMSANNFSGLVFNWLHSARAVSAGGRLSFAHRKLLDEATFLTPEARTRLGKLLTNAPSSLDTVREEILSSTDRRAADLLQEKLFDHHYHPLLTTLGAMDRTDRQAVDYNRMGKENFESFRRWSKPRSQRGVQIVELLPASRDDLVALSISDAGVVAKAAAQAEASAAYDLNKMRMIERNARLLFSALSSNGLASSFAPATRLTNFLESSEGNKRGRKEQEFSDFKNLSAEDTLSTFGAGGAAKGSLFARAGYAMAYARRREYLDAAITAAGRGDNFARWVVRKSDVRSSAGLLNKGRRAVAAAHTGFPNGDQPFFLLVKIPREATFQDWQGRKYIHFNSAYAATKRVSAWREAGFPGLVAKAPFALINPHWWTRIEEDTVGTVYPFKWNVRNSHEQNELLREPNPLGGAIWLDDTDKIRHSDVIAQLEAEENFIKLTREGQSGELGAALAGLQPEAESFRTNVLHELSEARKTRQALQPEDFNALTNRVSALEKALEELKAKPSPSTGTNTTDSTN